MNETGRLEIPSDETLVAFLDGELSAADAAGIRDLREREPVVAERLALLEQGLLPFAEAFAPLLQAAPQRRLQAGLASVQTTTPARGMGRRGFLAAAAACVGVGVLADRLLIAWQHSQWVEDGSWRGAVAQYMALYTADTLTGLPDQGDQLQRVAQQLGLSVTSQRLVVPDATLRRAQVLRYDSDVIAQLVYQDARYGPLALCFVRSTAPAAGPAAEVRRGLAVQYWNDGRHAWMLIGRNPADDLAAKARSLQRTG